MWASIPSSTCRCCKTTRQILERLRPLRTRLSVTLPCSRAKSPDFSSDFMQGTGWTGPPPPFFPSADHTAEERDELSEIIPRLYLTNYRGAENLKGLRAVHCSHIAAVGAEFMDNHANHAASQLNLKFWNKDITDDDEEGVSMGQSLLDAAEFIHNALQPTKKRKKPGVVVVHCAAGISRSATVVLGYLIIKHKQTLREAFSHVHASRPCIWPNEGFMSALTVLEVSVHGQSSISVDEYEHWGNYDGPEATDDDPAHHGLTREARHARAAQATDEVVRHHDEEALAVVDRVRKRFTWLVHFFGVHMGSRRIQPHHLPSPSQQKHSGASPSRRRGGGDGDDSTRWTGASPSPAPLALKGWFRPSIQRGISGE